MFRFTAPRGEDTITSEIVNIPSNACTEAMTVTYKYSLFAQQTPSQEMWLLGVTP